MCILVPDFLNTNEQWSMTLEFDVINEKGILSNTFHKYDIMFVILQNTIADSWFQRAHRYIRRVVKSVITLICKTFIKLTVVVSRGI